MEEREKLHHGEKLGNEYMQIFGMGLYEKTPKSVLCAVVVSLLSCGGDKMETVRADFLNEWRVLHEQGIIPQRPVQ